ncbi:hypothetical protein [Paraburkholderia strydomiana]|uniref:hypothetical protein n=1 Tax=Paraburkholderia strydomiana TaxID=1245417 RepID=UPI00285C65E6|nr:hypothetical protein [Paraburkholderia strydomiana]MDR7009873.1 hypothetical protein [Paraburkholderia strydomiana]
MQTIPVATPTASVRDLALPDGASQRVPLLGPAIAMRGLIVMFPDGADEAGIGQDGQIRNDLNFVVRAREARRSTRTSFARWLPTHTR